jgi:chromosome segregation ATPase
MESDTITATSTARGTQRETFSVSVTPVDEKRFESEIRRINVVISEEKKSREKFETQTEKAVNDLRREMISRFEKVDSRFEKVDARFDRMEKSIDVRFEKVDARFDRMEKSIDARFEKVDDEIKNLRNEVTTRMDRMDDRLWWIFGAAVISILIPIVMKYL